MSTRTLPTVNTTPDIANVIDALARIGMKLDRQACFGQAETVWQALDLLRQMARQM